MQYAGMTVNDPNPLKRFLHRRRLTVEEATFDRLHAGFDGAFLDYGAGDGVLTERLASRFPNATFVCYEPVEWIRREAEQRLAGFGNVRIVDRVEYIPNPGFDFVVCNEVLEHLPPAETDELLNRVAGFANADTEFLFGVPNEIYLPALIRGTFRIFRRRGAYDARLGNILRATIGRPPTDRPVDEIAEGFAYHFMHMGFDYRRLREKLMSRFDLVTVSGSPLPGWLNWFNFEIYFHCRAKAAVFEAARPLRKAA